MRQQLSAQASINGIKLIYDAVGRMVEQQNGSSYTQMLYSAVGKTAIMSGQTLVKAFVNLPGGGTAIYKPSGLAYYRHADWLGSSRLTSTPLRTVYSDSAYAPFGEQYTTSGTADASFTGQNADTASSWYDFTFREHSPTQGRWISPDPSGMAAADVTNPQSWNRYAYVVNNPLAMIDPLGLCGPADYTCDTGGIVFGGENSGGPGWDEFDLLSIPVVYSDSILVDGGCIGCGTGADLLGFVGTCYYALANPCGGPMGPPAINGTPKSPARQQCEQKAQQQYQQAKTEAKTNAWNGFKIGVFTTTAINAAAGCAIGGAIGAAAGTTIAEFTGATSSFGGAAVGCFTGGVDSALNGLVPSLFVGGITGGVSYFMDSRAATATYNQNMQACSQIQ